MGSVLHTFVYYITVYYSVLQGQDLNRDSIDGYKN